MFQGKYLPLYPPPPKEGGKWANIVFVDYRLSINSIFFHFQLSTFN